MQSAIDCEYKSVRETLNTGIKGVVLSTDPTFAVLQTAGVQRCLKHFVRQAAAKNAGEEEKLLLTNAAKEIYEAHAMIERSKCHPWTCDTSHHRGVAIDSLSSHRHTQRLAS